MNTKVITGIILVVVGCIALAYQGFTYTQKEKVFEVGPVQATAETEKHVPLPPIIGVALVGAGVVTLLVPRR